MGAARMLKQTDRRGAKVEPRNQVPCEYSVAAHFSVEMASEVPSCIIVVGWGEGGVG